MPAALRDELGLPTELVFLGRARSSAETSCCNIAEQLGLAIELVAPPDLQVAIRAESVLMREATKTPIAGCFDQRQVERNVDQMVERRSIEVEDVEGATQ